MDPAGGRDAGGAVGAALYAWHQIADQPRVADGVADGMSGAYLGPEFSDEEVARYLRWNRYPFEQVPEDGAWARRIAELVADGKVVGLFVGRMEFGPVRSGIARSSATPGLPRCSRS